jgi:hypothetical protein
LLEFNQKIQKGKDDFFRGKAHVHKNSHSQMWQYTFALLHKNTHEAISMITIAVANQKDLNWLLIVGKVPSKKEHAQEEKMLLRAS